MSRLSLFAACSAAAVLTVTGATSGSDAATRTVTTVTGVVTHGSLKNTPDTIGWLLDCQPSHTLPDDPIVHPGVPGAAHLHDFWGNASTDGDSTLASQEEQANRARADTYNASTVRAGSSCDLGQYAPGTSGDTASYWAPALFADGAEVTPGTKAELYYRSKPIGGSGFVPIPQDARIIVGSHDATSPATNSGISAGHLYWECSGTSTAHYPIPPTSCTGLLLNVVFPDCWDGKAMDHAGTNGTDNEHFTYADLTGNVCPSAFPAKLPQLSEKFKYTVAKKGMVLQLSADAGMGMGLEPTYTEHADFWNTWQSAALQYLVTNCINAGISCGTNPVTP